MALKLEALTSAVSNVALLARQTVDANAARVVAEQARDAAEATVAEAQNDIDRLVAELESALGITVATIVPAATQDSPAVSLATFVAPEVTPAPVAPLAPAEVQGLAAVSSALAMLAKPVPVNIYPPFDPRSGQMPSIPNAPKV